MMACYRVDLCGLFLSVFIAAAGVRACSPPVGGRDAWSLDLSQWPYHAENILYGRVVSTEDDPHLSYGPGSSVRVYQAEVEVYCVYKGEMVPPTATISKVGEVPGLCHSTELLEGHDYIIFFYRHSNTFDIQIQVEATEDNLNNVTRACGLSAAFATGSETEMEKCVTPASEDDCEVDRKELELDSAIHGGSAPAPPGAAPAASPGGSPGARSRAMTRQEHDDRHHSDHDHDGDGDHDHEDHHVGLSGDVRHDHDGDGDHDHDDHDAGDHDHDRHDHNKDGIHDDQDHHEGSHDHGRHDHDGDGDHDDEDHHIHDMHDHDGDGDHDEDDHHVEGAHAHDLHNDHDLHHDHNHDGVHDERDHHMANPDHPQHDHDGDGDHDDDDHHAHDTHDHDGDGDHDEDDHHVAHEHNEGHEEATHDHDGDGDHDEADHLKHGDRSDVSLVMSSSVILMTAALLLVFA